MFEVDFGDQQFLVRPRLLPQSHLISSHSHLTSCTRALNAPQPGRLLSSPLANSNSNSESTSEDKTASSESSFFLWNHFSSFHTDASAKTLSQLASPLHSSSRHKVVTKLNSCIWWCMAFRRPGSPQPERLLRVRLRPQGAR